MTRADILAVARAAIGTPFRHQGRRAGAGLDCAGLLIHVATELGVETRDRVGYARMPSNGQLEAAIAEHVALGVLTPAPLDPLPVGAVVLMRFENEGAARHLGVVGDGTLIHAWAVARKVCEHHLDDVWRRRIVGAWRFAGVGDE